MEALGRQIATGAWPEGAAMPIERELAEQFGVSRVVVREAVKSLAAKGMVVVRPRTGTRVRPRAAWSLLDAQVIGWRAAPGPDGRPALEAKFVADLMELRRIVEPPAVRLAAVNATVAELAALRHAFVRMVLAVAGQGDYIPADLDFHGLILTASGNQFLHQLRGALSEILKASFTLSSREPGDRAGSLRLHEQVLLGLESRDPAAAGAAIEALIGLSGRILERDAVAGVGGGAAPG